MKYTDITILRGLKIESAMVFRDEIHIRASDRSFKIYHQQECCENVSLEEVVGDLQKLVGNTIKHASEVTEGTDATSDLSATDTIQTLEDDQGNSVMFVWHGESNGYYGESVDTEEL